MNFRFWNPIAPPTILPAYSEEPGVETRRMTVCLVNEGSYPHYRGGVSTWCDMLVRGLPEIDFVLVSLVADPSASRSLNYQRMSLS